MVFCIAIGALALFVFINYLPAIYWGIRASISEKRLKKELKAIEEEGLFEECRIVITKPLGIGEEPVGKITFENAMQNQSFAVSSIMDLMGELKQ